MQWTDWVLSPVIHSSEPLHDLELYVRSSSDTSISSSDTTISSSDISICQLPALVA